jgi:hypothetical protein
MRKTITEKAVTAINELNKAALIMARQMKSGEIDKALADKSIFAAQRKSRTANNAYFARTDDASHLQQIREFHHLHMYEELEIAENRFNKVLKHYAKAVGVDFEE